MEDEYGLTREEIIALAERANRARRAGFTDEQVSEELMNMHGFDRKTLFAMLRSQPKYEAPKALSTKDMLALLDQGASLGLGGPGAERVQELREMGHDTAVTGMRALGGLASAVAVPTGLTGANIVRKTGVGLAPQLVRGAVSGSVRSVAGAKDRAAMILNALRELSPSVGAFVKGTGEGVAKAGRLATRIAIGRRRGGLGDVARTGAALYGYDKIFGDDD